jgi:glycosyltransferase involved in cell wall biosynthesis
LRIDAGKPVQGAVSVLIPTVRRYTYLRTLLGQLRAQTIPPLEIIVVDQTPQAERDTRLEADFSDLPLRYLTMDKAGQCASRNLGLRKAQGAYILFIDDDDEVPPDLIEKHLAALHTLGVQVSNGVAHEVGTGELPADFRMMRISNVFPTNNTMIRKDVLNQSGLFDLAYDHGQRADHDLGMRIYLSGELMVLDPSIAVVHHHAPLGGLREHRARVSTYAAARTGLFKFDLPSVSDLYLAKRYFSKRQVREMQWISLLGTFSLRGSKGMRLLKGLIAFVWLPYHLGVLHKRRRRAEQLLQDYPQIPNLKEEALL